MKYSNVTGIAYRWKPIKILWEGLTFLASMYIIICVWLPSPHDYKTVYSLFNKVFVLYLQYKNIVVFDTLDT